MAGNGSLPVSIQVNVHSASGSVWVQPPPGNLVGEVWDTGTSEVT